MGCFEGSTCYMFYLNYELMRTINAKLSGIMRVAICLLLMPFFSWSQEITAVDYSRALEDVHSFKKRFFEVYPPKKAREFSKVVLAERENTLYETLSAEVPYILLSDKAISLEIKK